MILLITGLALAVGAWSVEPVSAEEQPPKPNGDVSTEDHVVDCVSSGHPNLELWDGYGSWETPAVKRAQCLLNWALTYYPPLEVDGEFGPMTRQRVIEFQQCMVYVHQHDIYIDGEIGRQTWPLLESWAYSEAYAC